jgi:hypothetical protein
MSSDIRAIETEYNGYRFRSRLEARWAIFFRAINLDYEYELEGFQMDDIRYLPDFYIPSIDRWLEIKGQPLSIPEIKKCEEFCYRKGKDDIKFSILIGAPQPVMYQDEGTGQHLLGVMEYTWEWTTSKLYPENTRILAQGIVREEYYSRFIPAIWKVQNVTDEQLMDAAKKAREARFEFGEKPE